MAIATKISHRLRAERASTRSWAKEQKRDNSLLSNAKHVTDYLDAIEEWRRLEDHEFALRNLTRAKK
jgi:hypothetical protein